MTRIAYLGLLLLAFSTVPVLGAAAAASEISPVIAERNFELREGSRHVDVLISVVYREDGQKLATFSLCKKGGSTPHQTIQLPDTHIESDQDGQPQEGHSLSYASQSAVFFGDFNFDGREDLALCDGTHANYESQSYRIYLASARSRRLLYDKSFSELGQATGMFVVDPVKRVLRTHWQEGHALEVIEEYAVISGRPVKVVRKEIEALPDDDTQIKVTTRRRTAGKWQVKVAVEKRAP